MIKSVHKGSDLLGCSLSLVVDLEVPLEPVPSLGAPGLPYVLGSLLDVASLDKIREGGVKGSVVFGLLWDGAEPDYIIDVSVVVLVPGVDDGLLEHGVQLVVGTDLHADLSEEILVALDAVASIDKVLLDEVLDHIRHLAEIVSEEF